MEYTESWQSGSRETTALVERPPCEQCAQYEVTIAELEALIQRTQEFSMLSDTRDQIRYRTATERQRAGLPAIRVQGSRFDG